MGSSDSGYVRNVTWFRKPFVYFVAFVVCLNLHLAAVVYGMSNLLDDLSTFIKKAQLSLDLTTLSGVDYTAGRWRDAVSFDGVDDFIVVPGGSEAIDERRSLTIDVWVRYDGDESSGQSLNRIISKDSVGTKGQFILWQRNGYLFFQVVGEDMRWYCVKGSYMRPKVWMHIIATYDAQNKRLLLYENGGLVASSKGPVSMNSSVTNELVVGASSNYQHLWHGAIDEIKMYNRVLSVEEIKNSYAYGEVVYDDSLMIHCSMDEDVEPNNQNIRYTTAREYDNACNVATTKVMRFSIDAKQVTEVGYSWNGHKYALFDESNKLHFDFHKNNCGAIYSLVGGYSGVLNGVDYTVGRWGSALLFNKESGRIALQGTGDALDMDGSMTIEVWVRTNKVAQTAQRIICKDKTGVVGKFILMQRNGRIEFKVADQNMQWYSAVGSALVQDVWTHLVAVYDAENKRLRLYQNGEKTSDVVAPATLLSNPSIDITIGGSFDDKQRWEGSVDALRLYNRAFSEVDVREHRTATVFKNAKYQWSMYVEKNLTLERAACFGYALMSDAHGDPTVVSPTRFFCVGTQTSPDLSVWAFGDPHIHADNGLTYRSLEEAIKDVEGVTDAPSAVWDIALVAGDYVGKQTQPEDSEGEELISQFSCAGADQNRFYGVAGNHDSGYYDASWFCRWVDPMGDHTVFSGIDNLKRPYSVEGQWDHYSFQVGNVLYLMIGDVNYGGSPFGRGQYGGYPAGRVTYETYAWWVNQVEANQDKIIITVAHQSLLNTTSYTGYYEGWKYGIHGGHSWADRRGSSIVYAIDDWSIDGLNEKNEIVGKRPYGFKKYLEDHPGAIDFWLFGHTHYHLYPNACDENGRSEVESKHGVYFVNVGSVHVGNHGQAAVPFSRFFHFSENSSVLTMKTYLHKEWLTGKKGFYPEGEKKFYMRKVFNRVTP